MGEHIPKLSSKEEEAAFWQKTGLDQLSPDEYEEVQVERPHRPLSATFAVRFDPKTVELLRQVARSQSLGATQLVRAWVLERLKIEKAAGVLAEPTGQFPHDFEIVLRGTVIKTFIDKIPAAVEAAMQEVLDRMDQEREDLLETT